MLEKIVYKLYSKNISDCNNEELYYALLEMVKNLIHSKPTRKSGKKVYYISAEFLIGKLLSNNLINLGLYNEIDELLTKNGKSLSQIEEYEPEPSLGNGGLGRLAACFLDSIATLGLNGVGIGLNYHYGLFRQKFENNLQKEYTNPWIENENWLTKTGISYTTEFGGFSLKSVMYDIDVTGYKNEAIKLHLFDLESSENFNQELSGIDFDKTDIKNNLTLFLYPDDSDENGKLLRLYQQYFMVSNAAKLIIDEALASGSSLYDLDKYAVIQINDTHPSLIIPELIRILSEKGVMIDEAIKVVRKTCAYTNHTILAEALEKWPIDYLKKVCPQLVPIIVLLNNIVCKKYNVQSVSIIDNKNLVHMAHMDIHYGFSINGVAHLHTEILKNSELKNFYEIYPKKFNNKTNGITFRRWLYQCNPQLTILINNLIGTDYQQNEALLKNLENYLENEDVLKRLLDIKHFKKLELKDYLKEKTGITVDAESIFDIQIKRLHEYKRQQLNGLYLIHKYFEIKSGEKPVRPITAIFGAKAAPAYTIAKDIIHMILCLQEIINNDKDVSPYLKVIMVENYNVTYAEKLIPAADIHEQISLASKEASGTSNMKFMLNGAIAIGTLDGANVEIHDFVGDENIYIFGDSSDTVIDRYAKGTYNPRDYIEKNTNLKKALDFIISDTMLKVGKKENLLRLYNELITKDWFMTFPDFDDYVKTKEKMYSDYEDRESWAKKMLVNISNAGYFSSDRTIMQYNTDIWKL